MDMIVIYEGEDKCTLCLGWKRVANTDDGESWKYWEELPGQSKLAVRMGWVAPIECPRCKGSGIEPKERGMFADRRFGRIEVGDAFIEKEPEICADIFAKLKILVLRCEHIFYARTFEYDIYSPLLPVLPDGCRFSNYRILVTNHYDEQGKVIDFEAKFEAIDNLYSPVLGQDSLESFFANIRNAK